MAINTNKHQQVKDDKFLVQNQNSTATKIHFNKRVYLHNGELVRWI